MSDFICREDFHGKNLIMQDIFVPFDTSVESDDRYLYFEGYPFCFIDSQVARDYFVWNGDGKGSIRKGLEEIIIFLPREREWEVQIPIYDEQYNIIGYKKGYAIGRYTPQEVEYIKKNFPKLVKDGPNIEWSDWLFIGSDIKELQELASYLSR